MESELVSAGAGKACRNKWRPRAFRVTVRAARD